jgi:DnaK suppressor protein
MRQIKSLKMVKNSRFSQVSFGSTQNVGEQFINALPAGYKPSEEEEFMNDMHKTYFQLKLMEWRNELLKNSLSTLHYLQECHAITTDPADNASLEEDLSSELHKRDRERKLLVKIEEALQRIQEGSYGYCEETGEPIHLGRLEARPVATLSLEAQERRERFQRTGSR